MDTILTELPSLNSEGLNTLTEKCLSSLKSEDRKTVLEKHYSSLGSEELETLSKKFKSIASCKNYFHYGDTVADFQEKNMYPPNATALVTDGTIQVLEVMEDGAWFCYEAGHAEKIKMKIVGIDEMVHLYHSQHGGKHTFTESISLEIGGKKFAYAWGDYPLDNDSVCPGNVLEALHQAMGIPKHHTEKMVNLLFFPYGVDFDKFECDVWEFVMEF